MAKSRCMLRLYLSRAVPSEIRFRSRANDAAAGQTKSGVKSCGPCTGNGGSKTASTAGELTTRPRKARMTGQKARPRRGLKGRGMPLQVQQVLHPPADPMTMFPPSKLPGLFPLSLIPTSLPTGSSPVFPRMVPTVPLFQSAPVFPGATPTFPLPKLPSIFPRALLSNSVGGLPRHDLTTPSCIHCLAAYCGILEARVLDEETTGRAWSPR